MRAPKPRSSCQSATLSPDIATDANLLACTSVFWTHRASVYCLTPLIPYLLSFSNGKNFSFHNRAYGSDAQHSLVQCFEMLELKTKEIFSVWRSPSRYLGRQFWDRVRPVWPRPVLDTWFFILFDAVNEKPVETAAAAAAAASKAVAFGIPNSLAPFARRNILATHP